MKTAIIVAAASNDVIGCDNRLPWHLPQDLKYFKSVTLGKPVIMGRKTFESIGRPLPGRANIVITRNPSWSAPGVEVAGGLGQALALAVRLAPSAEAMVIGGEEIYRQALPLVDKIYLTRLDLVVDGDAFFPSLKDEDWSLVSSRLGEPDAPVAHNFLVYERR